MYMYTVRYISLHATYCYQITSTVSTASLNCLRAF